MTILDRGLLSKGLISKGLIEPPPQRWVYDFDGIDDYGVLDSRAINVDGNIDIEWSQSKVTLTGVHHIISQTNSATFGQREFLLRWTASGSLNFVLGNSGVNFLSTHFRQSGKFKINYSEETVRLFVNETLVQTINYARGETREPFAPTRVGVRNNGGAFVEYINGQIYNLKINGVLWKMLNNGSTIQPSTPAGNNMTLVNMNPDRWSKIPV